MRTAINRIALGLRNKQRSVLKGPARAAVESLENRRLLTATPVANLLGPLPGDLTGKIETRLWATAQSVLRHKKNSLMKTRSVRVDSKDRVEVYVHTDGNPNGIVGALKAVGAAVNDVVASMHVAAAFVPANMLDQVGRLKGVGSVTLPDYAVTNVTSAGDGVAKADKVRSQFAEMGIDGTGIKVGVISDGVDHRLNVGAELPAVTVDPSHPGSGDEGTAMLEIVHDLAPGADLYFAGPTNSASMVSSINYLKNQGCDVIIDDLTFFGESYFSDSSVANAAAGAVSSGVVYVTSAGNYSNQQHYQGQYVQSTSAFGGGRLHRFSSTPDDSENLTIPNGKEFRAFLEWSDQWGASGNNYDLYLFDSNSFTQLDSSLIVQNGNDNPIESIDWVNNTGTTMQAELWIVRKNGAASRELELFTLGNSSLQFNTTGDALIGQQAVSQVLSVAASSAANPTTIESYSSRGGSTIYTNFTTQTKTVRQTLDGTSTDGVQTDIGQLGFFGNPFFGTSAASPHAGAIAALIRQAAPSLTPAEVIQVMADTATDIGAAGYDTNSGAGLYNALDAMYKLYAPIAPDLAVFDDHGVSDSDNITYDNTPTFSGNVPAASYVRLYVDGVQSAAVQLTAAQTNFELVPAAPLLDGTHLITIRLAANSSVALSNNSGFSPALTVKIDTVAPTISSGTFNYAGPTPQSISYDFSENVASSAQASDLNLLNTATNTPLDSSNFAVGALGGNSLGFTFPGYPRGTLPDGIYAATIAAGDITDLAGNPLVGDSVLDFFFLNGDVDHNGAVNAHDLGVLSTNWQGTSRVFNQGDFNYDGVVDIKDLAILATNWQKDLFA